MNNEKRFYITKEEFLSNMEEFKQATSTGLINHPIKELNGFSVKLLQKTNDKKFTGTYATWSDVLIWMKIKYPNHFFVVKDVKGNDIIGQLFINGDLQMETLLSTEIYSSGHKEKSEALVLRVYTKLVAMVTGFGIDLWNDKYFSANNQMKKNSTSKKKITFGGENYGV